MKYCRPKNPCLFDLDIANPRFKFISCPGSCKLACGSLWVAITILWVTMTAVGLGQQASSNSKVPDDPVETRPREPLADSQHWSFQPIVRPATPFLQATGIGNPIDSFVYQRLVDAKVSPSGQANPATLIRRVSLDLVGLPPTPEQVDQYLNDKKPGRFERWVERLLASPRYGERWATPWLDLCHYADTDGYLTDQLRPVAWRYRDWLVTALNANQPFDQQTIEQLGGDLLPGSTLQQKLATGFLRQTLSNREGGAEPEEFRVKQIVDRSEMVGTVWLGLTVGCARCHDHKYDPIEQQEFFELYACLDNADEINIDAPLPRETEAFFNSRAEYQLRRNELIDPLRKEIEALQKRWEKKCLQAYQHPANDPTWDRQWELLGLVWGGGLGEGQLEGQEIIKLPWERRSSRQKDDLLDYFLGSPTSVIDPDRAKELKLDDLRGKLTTLKDKFPKATRAPVMQSALSQRQSYIHQRGDFRDRGENVSPSTLNCLPTWKQEGNDARLAMAKWLVARDNPLTARVTVNRMWEQFFGRGLVVTTEDFGTRGTPPSHPGLLDWLAAEFRDSGWDIKAIHRLIVTSETYKRSSAYRDDLLSVDPDNLLLARQNSLRVPAEVVRDAGLAVSGLLDHRMNGPSVFPPQPQRVNDEGFGNHLWKTSPGGDRYRRGLYTFVIRTTPFAQGITFDAPNPNEICTRRIRSNTPLQALTLLNDPVFFEMAEALANRLQREAQDEPKRIKLAFRLCFSRDPTRLEQTRLVQFLSDQGGSKQTSETDRWTRFCSVLLNLHEFITRD